MQRVVAVAEPRLASFDDFHLDQRRNAVIHLQDRAPDWLQDF